MLAKVALAIGQVFAGFTITWSIMLAIFLALGLETGCDPVPCLPDAASSDFASTVDLVEPSSCQECTGKLTDCEGVPSLCKFKGPATKGCCDLSSLNASSITSGLPGFVGDATKTR